MSLLWRVLKLGSWDSELSGLYEFWLAVGVRVCLTLVCGRNYWSMWSCGRWRELKRVFRKGHCKKVVLGWSPWTLGEEGTMLEMEGVSLGVAQALRWICPGTLARVILWQAYCSLVLSVHKCSIVGGPNLRVCSRGSCHDSFLMSWQLVCPPCSQ